MKTGKIWKRLPFVRGKIKVINDQEIEVIVDEASTAMPELVEACKGEGITVETIEANIPLLLTMSLCRLIEKETANV